MGSRGAWGQGVHGVKGFTGSGDAWGAESYEVHRVPGLHRVKYPPLSKAHYQDCGTQDLCVIPCHHSNEHDSKVVLFFSVLCACGTCTGEYPTQGHITPAQQCGCVRSQT